MFQKDFGGNMDKWKFNYYPGHDILQLPVYTPDNLDMKYLIDDFM